MNPFLEIKKQTEQQQSQSKNNQPAIYAVDNIKGGSIYNPNKLVAPRPRKKDYLFSLYPKDRELLNELASQAGLITPKGKPNASAYLTVVIRHLGGVDE